MKSEMTSRDVTEFYRQIDFLGIEIWIDGGWGVDALLGTQTRRHVDLDIVLQDTDCGSVVEFLRKRGFREIPRDDSRPCNFVMGNDNGKEIDFHVIILDDDGNGLYGLPEAVEGTYPADALRGRGTIDGLPVRCTSPEFQIRSHSGYDLNDTDVKDVSALAHKFGLDLPQEFRMGFNKNG